MNLKIKAAILSKQKKPLLIKNIYLKNPLSKGQVLIKLMYSGICGSQIGEIDGVKGKDQFLPHLLGHEATGIILEKDKNVKNFKIGDKVILHWKIGKGINSKTPVYSYREKKINAGWVTTFNDYAVVSENRITKLPKNLSMKQGVVFGCALTTAYGVVHNDAKVSKNDKLLIIGSGNIGLPMVLFSKFIGCKKIVVVEKAKSKLILSKKFGADLCIQFKNENIFTKQIKRIFNNGMPNKIIENTGNTKMIEMSYDILNNSGTLVLVGVPHFKKKVCINTLPLHMGKNLKGSHGGGVNPSLDIPAIAKLIKGKLNINKLIGNVYKLSDINKVIDNMRLGKEILKPIIKF